VKTLESAKLARQEQSSILKAAQALKAELPVSRVILFGSKARGMADLDSDIDLLVLTLCPVTTSLRAKVSDRLADINLENDVSLTSIVVSEQDWSNGLIHHMLIHSEVERDGCEI
jgi:predicted nucleotidyltransferase